MKIREIVSAKETLTTLSQNKELPTKTAFKIYLMINKVNASLGFFEEKRNDIFKKYGVENNGMVEIPQDKIQEVTPLMNDILDLDVPEEIEKVDISLDIDLGISPADIQLLIPFINFVE